MRAAILLFLTVILIAPPAVCQSSDDNLIVPGVRIGRWRLGMSIDELVRIHGKGTRTTSFSKGLAPDFDFLHDGLAYAWDADDMEVFTFGRPLAEELEVGRRSALPYHTAAGVGIKNTRADILRTYGKPTAAAKSYGYARLIYDALGIAVRVENGTGWVRTIAIFKPGSARQIWKF
jgi:hypothetical protein